jgi:hypothetical protein
VAAPITKACLKRQFAWKAMIQARLHASQLSILIMSTGTPVHPIIGSPPQVAARASSCPQAGALAEILPSSTPSRRAL